VQSLSSQTFVRDLEPQPTEAEKPSRIADRLDPETFERLERLRRGETS
jgi:hypothetical protein